jgi:hypothetical protein
MYSRCFRLHSHPIREVEIVGVCVGKTSSVFKRKERKELKQTSSSSSSSGSASKLVGESAYTHIYMFMYIYMCVCMVCIIDVHIHTDLLHCTIRVHHVPH